MGRPRKWKSDAERKEYARRQETAGVLLGGLKLHHRHLCAEAARRVSRQLRAGSMVDAKYGVLTNSEEDRVARALRWFDKRWAMAERGECDYPFEYESAELAEFEAV